MQKTMGLKVYENWRVPALVPGLDQAPAPGQSRTSHDFRLDRCISGVIASITPARFDNRAGSTPGLKARGFLHVQMRAMRHPLHVNPVSDHTPPLRHNAMRIEL